MKKIYFLLFYFSFFIFSNSFSQGVWTWISGADTVNSAGVYGTQGIPSVNNHPPGIYEGVDWKDKQGNFWLFGGWNSSAVYSDIWKYNPVTNEWTWVKGNGAINLFPIYGIKGVSDSSNTPAGRTNASASWVDTSGNFWLFGGASPGNLRTYNDLWKYDVSANNWIWMNGDSSGNGKGVHGIQGVPDSFNTPGSRIETCTAWTDSSNNLWLWGGRGYGDNSNYGSLNDLCKYDIAANEWTWMKGSALENAPPDYGIKGMPDASNDPGGRYSYTKWKDNNDNFWIMGGINTNDVWKYDLSVNEWTWMDGPDKTNDSGYYIHNCIYDTSDVPCSRMEHRSSVTDNCGRFWMFGGRNNTTLRYLNDLWVFDPEQLKWEWLNGSNLGNEQGNYGSLKVPSPANSPPSRWGALGWWGNNNAFYLFGGSQTSTSNCYSDLWVFNPDTNCVSLASCPAVDYPPLIAGFAADKTTICSNDCINFSNYSSYVTSWQWYFQGAVDSTSAEENPKTICYLTPGIYNVTLILSNSAGSDTLTLNNYITVDAAPLTPVIIQLNDTLLYINSDSSYKAYQWYMNTTPVKGATDTFLIFHQAANYNVQVSNANGCKIAVGINVILGLHNYMKDHGLTLSPNPTPGRFTVYGLRFTGAAMNIYNLLGEVIYSRSLSFGEDGGEAIDVSSLSSGIYFVQVANAKERWIGKLVKE